MFYGIIGSSIINRRVSQDFIDHHIGDEIKIKNDIKKS
jgi:hypothetical protein